MPALVGAHLLPLSTSSNTSDFSLASATDVITTCTTQFLSNATGAGVDLIGLSLLASNCNFTGELLPNRKSDFFASPPTLRCPPQPLTFRSV